MEDSGGSWMTDDGFAGFATTGWVDVDVGWGSLAGAASASAWLLALLLLSRIPQEASRLI